MRALPPRWPALRAWHGGLLPPWWLFFLEHTTHPCSGGKNYFSRNYAPYSWMFAENCCSPVFGPIPTLPNPYPCS